MIKVLSITFNCLPLLSVLSLSHDTGTPEIRFSINKQILEAHEYTIYQEILEALRLAEDELNQVSGMFNF